MCGIIGWINLKEAEKQYHQELQNGLDAMQFRGPDGHGIFTDPDIQLGHARLAILDLSAAANQPMFSEDERYVLVFNGEIFNYQELKSKYEQAGKSFKTTSDTEVLLHMLIQEGPDCLNQLNGFFAIAFYDRQTQKLIIARDRLGIKPFHIYQNEKSLFFASEVKALLKFPVVKKINLSAVRLFFELNYLPPAVSMLQGCYKLSPGHLMIIQKGEIQTKQYYQIPYTETTKAESFEKSCKTLENLLDDATAKRLIADVPVGVFLSGGIDSSVVTALASRHTKHLNTFSISFNDPVYDETYYAELVAKKFGTEHTVFKLSYEELFENLEGVLNYIDEPFADASSVNFYILSKYTRKHITVALSGDGADELLAGYSKHLGEFNARHRTLINSAMKLASPLLQMFPANRNSSIGRKIFQVQKYAAGLTAGRKQRYWKWASVSDPDFLDKLLLAKDQQAETQKIRNTYLDKISENESFNDVLLADMQLVLGGDMLTKVDLMSMANSLEVRSPFLDYRVVNFAFGLPADYKIDFKNRKKILQDAFKHILPAELYNRPKQGFEVPLRQWFVSSMKGYIEKELLNKEKIEAQGIFNYEVLKDLYNTIVSGKNTKEDWTLWAVIVFQHWYDRYFNEN